jgi:hypothetical protein
LKREREREGGVAGEGRGGEKRERRERTLDGHVDRSTS